MIEPNDATIYVDFPELLIRVGNDHDFLREILQIFKEEFADVLRSLQEAIRSGDWKKLTFDAHTLKGMLMNLSFTAAAASAVRLESMGRQGVTPAVQEELAKLERDTSLALAELEAFCSKTTEDTRC